MSGLFFASFFTGISGAITLGAAVCGVCAVGRLRGMTKRDALIAVCCFAAAVGYIRIYTAVNYDRVTAYGGTEGSFSGRIVGIKSYPGEKALYTLKGSINGSRTAKITVYTDDTGARYGDIMDIGSCGFSVPEDDYLYKTRGKLRSEGVYVTVSGAKDVTVQSKHRSPIKNRLMSYREHIVDEFRSELGEEKGTFLAGMIFGRSVSVDDDVRTSLSRCGIAHILAVSGLHVSIAAFAFMWLMKRLRVRRTAAFALMNLFTALLVIMAESPLSAVRAAIMLDFMYASGLFRRQNDTFTSLAAAVLLICIVNPYAVYSGGFQLSVAGTFGIGVAAPYMTRNISAESIPGALLKSVLSMLCAALCIMPLSMMYFDETSLVSPLTNVFMVPLCTAVLIAGLVYVFTGGIISLLFPARYAIGLVLSAADRISRLDGAYFTAGGDRTVFLAFGGAAVAAVVQLVIRSRKCTAALAALAFGLVFLSSTFYTAERYDRFTVAVLGKGSDAAAVVSFHGRTDVIDLSGDHRTPAYVRKYMMKNGIGSAEVLVLSSKVQSAYSSYEAASGHISAGKLLLAGDIPPAGDDGEVCFGEECRYSTEDYTVSCSGGRTVISFGENKVSFLPAREGGSSDEGLCVYYGSITKNTEIRQDSNALYLDKKEENAVRNFELILDRSGGYRIRRL